MHQNFQAKGSGLKLLSTWVVKVTSIAVMQLMLYIAKAAIEIIYTNVSVFSQNGINGFKFYLLFMS